MAKKKGGKKPAAPSGLAVDRNNNKYTITWKRAKNYGAQELYYTVNDGEQKPITVGAKDTTKSATITKNEFYPKSKDGVQYPKVTNLSFHVKGKVGKNWSDPASKQYAISVPPKPTLNANYSNDVENKTTFAWNLSFGDESQSTETTTNTKETTHSIFTNYQWWTSLLPNSDLDSDKVTTWQDTGTTTDDVVESDKGIEEKQTAFIGNYSYTRYFKLVARGPAGDSKPAYAKHVYAYPNAPKNVKASAVRLETQGYRVSVRWTVDESKSRPIDNIYVQYAIVKPISSHTDVNGVRKVTLTAPTIPESSWTAAATLANDSNQNKAEAGTTFTIDNSITEDNWIFVRVVSKHDNRTSASETVFVTEGQGLLLSPSGLSVEISGNTAEVTVAKNSTVDESVTAIYYRTDKNPTPMLLGVQPVRASTKINVQIPDGDGSSNICFGAKNFVADYTPITPKTSGVTEYAFSNIRMESYGIVWDETAVPNPPSNIGLSSPRTGVVRITWDWTWTSANGVEISWADHEDAWESTDEPTTYVLENKRVSAWNISGLDVGTWYFRIRLFKTENDATTYGAYSNTKSIKIAASPATPVLTLSPTITSPDGKVTCYWAFTANEGDEQVQADICEATLSDTGAATYGKIVARANNEQFKTLNIKDLGWEPGSKHYLAVKIVTASGESSDNWSVPKPIQILSPITCTINSTSLQSVTVDGLQRLRLTEMPLTVSATGAGEGGAIAYILERAEDYHLDRPDESEVTGFKGETVALIQRSASNASGQPANYDVSIGVSDLIGPLDDGAKYNLIAIAKDSYGQTAYAALQFDVVWSHQAIMPTAIVEADTENMVSFITPVKPTVQEGYAEGDTCDIYRLSIDKPELIVKNAAFGTKYVDLYPTLGKMGGHRVVYKTLNGDYITEDNEFAWTDYDEDTGDIIDVFASIIDFGDDQIILPYDLSLSNSWAKDFTKTRYLGGAVQGDWNPSVDRTGSFKGRVAVQQDSDLVIAIRNLANYAGVCHVRTPDGSSYDANVDVTEDREEKMINKIASFSFNISKVDSQGHNSMTYDEWNKQTE